MKGAEDSFYLKPGVLDFSLNGRATDDENRQQPLSCMWRGLGAQWEHDPELFVSGYAASHPSEDFAETFMLFLRHKGKIPRHHNTPAIRAKWNFIGLLGRTLAAGRRKW